MESTSSLMKPILIKHPSVLKFHSLGLFLSPYKSFFSSHKWESLPCPSKPWCYSIYTSSSITPLRKLFVFMSIWCILHPIVEVTYIITWREVYLATGENYPYSHGETYHSSLLVLCFRSETMVVLQSLTSVM